MRWKHIPVGLLLALALWVARPAGCVLYHSFQKGKASGAWVFSIVQAAGELSVGGGV